MRDCCWIGSDYQYKYSVLLQTDIWCPSDPRQSPPRVWFEGKKLLNIKILHAGNHLWSPDLVLPHSYHSSRWVWLDWTRKIQNSPWSILGKGRTTRCSSGRLALQSRWSLRWPRVVLPVSPVSKTRSFWKGEGWGGKNHRKRNKNLKISAVDLAGNKENQTGWRKTFVKSIFCTKTWF